MSGRLVVVLGLVGLVSGFSPTTPLLRNSLTLATRQAAGAQTVRSSARKLRIPSRNHVGGMAMVASTSTENAEETVKKATDYFKPLVEGDVMDPATLSPLCVQTAQNF